MNETSVFCILGIAALGFVIFTDVETMEIRREHRALSIGRIVFSIAGILLLTIVLVGEMK